MSAHPDDNVLAQLVDGTLDDPRRVDVERHLDSCAPCSELVAELARVVAPTRAVKDSRYAPGAEIARGGMGRVVEATDTLLGRTVALKEALSTDDDLRRRFIREVRITARLEHPSIVPVYDAGMTPDPFYVMRKVTGRPLEELVNEATTVGQRLALLPNLLAATHALAHAHGRGIVHRDIKPANILIGTLGETVVIDWGLAKVIGDDDDAPALPLPSSLGDDTVHTHLGSVVGTPGFMSPEQLRGEPVDARSDVYALGATLYFTLARRLPHAAPSGDEMMKAAKAGPPPAVTTFVDGIPAALVTIVDRALAYDHERRYHDAAGLAEDLDRFLKGQLVASHRYSRGERLVRFWKRHRLALTIAAIAVVALTVLGVVSVSRILRERDRADRALVQALDRNDQLELARARSLVTTNPTAAVALAKPLANRYWREARSIALAARAAGVARGYPASKRTTSIAFTADGVRALTAGRDGVLRIHDVVARTTRELASLGAEARAVFADGDRAVVAWAGPQLVVLDVASGQRHAVRTAVEPRELVVRGTTVWWVGADGSVWTHGLREPPAQFAIDDQITALAVTDGAVALAGATGVWIARGAAPERMVAGKATAVAWHGERLGSIVDGRVIEAALDGRVVRDVPFADARSIAWQDNKLHVGGDGRVTPLGGEAVPIGDGVVLVMVPGPGGSLLARTDTNTLVVVDHNVVLKLPPTSSIGVIAASPRGHVVLTGSDNVVLAWDLRPLLPRAIALAGPAMWAVHDRDQVIVSHEHVASWVDVKTGERTVLPVRDAQSRTIAPGAAHALVIDPDDRATLFARGQAQGTTLELAVHMAAFVSPDRLLLATRAGDVHQYDIATRATTRLAQLEAQPRIVQTMAGWVCLLTDRVLWRLDLRTGAMTTLPTSSALHIALLDNGEVAVTDRQRLRVWKPDGALVDHAELLPPVMEVFRAGPRHVIVYTGGDSGSIVELDGARRATNVYPPGSRMLDQYVRDDISVYRDTGGTLYVAENLTGHAWKVGAPRHGALDDPGLSADQSRIVATAGDHLLIWEQPFPTDAGQTTRLLDELTNAPW